LKKEKIYLKKVKEYKHFLDGCKCCHDISGNICYFIKNCRDINTNIKYKKICTKEHIIFLPALKPIPLRKKNCYRVNDRFKFRLSDDILTIKGAWDVRYPKKATCFLMNENGIGHAYAGIVTPVKDVWNITEEEFSAICGGHPEWFTKICSATI